MKKNILSIVIVAVIGLVGTSYAAYKMNAKEIYFDNKGLLQSNDMQSALNELSTLIQDKIGSHDISNIEDGTITGVIANMTKIRQIVVTDNFSVNSSNQLTGTSHKDFTIDLSKYNFKKTPIVVSVEFPWCTWQVMSISQTKLTLRIYSTFSNSYTAHSNGNNIPITLIEVY